MKKILLIMAFALPFGLSSCSEEDPPNNVYKEVWDSSGYGIYVCCFGSGNDCSKIGWAVLMPVFANYATTNNVSGFFLQENWQQYIPELVQQPALVSEIIAQNPKAVFLNDHFFVLLKNKDLPVSESNVLYAFVDNAAEEPCAGYPGN